MKDRILLAHSGSLDTSVAIAWLAEEYDAEIITVTLDLGQGGELDEVRGRALATGAVRAHVLDVREEFARDYILPALQAGATYEGRYPLGTALGHPVIARMLVEIAAIENAGAIAHGCADEGNDQVRLELSVRALNPVVRILAPARVWGMTGPEKIEYARTRRVALPTTLQSPYSVDSNLWGRSIACGALEDPWQEPPQEIYRLTRQPAAAPTVPAYVEIAFERGVPVAVNGVALGLVELIESLTTIAGGHGVGRIDMVENLVTAVKSREIYEAPAAVVLHAAHQELTSFVSSRDLDRLTRELSVRYADLVYNGLWFTPMREALDAFTAKVQQRVTGVVRVKLFKGAHTVVGRQSPSTPDKIERAHEPNLQSAFSIPL
jgi:argininosuccinate synthase